MIMTPCALACSIAAQGSPSVGTAGARAPRVCGGDCASPRKRAAVPRPRRACRDVRATRCWHPASAPHPLAAALVRRCTRAARSRALGPGPCGIGRRRGRVVEPVCPPHPPIVHVGFLGGGGHVGRARAALPLANRPPNLERRPCPIHSIRARADMPRRWAYGSFVTPGALRHSSHGRAGQGRAGQGRAGA